MSEIDYLIIINSVGSVMEHKIAENYKNEANYKVLEKIARKVSLRFKIVEFDDILEECLCQLIF